MRREPEFVVRKWDTGLTFEDVEERMMRVMLPPDADRLHLAVEGAWRTLDRERVEWLRDTFTHWLETGGLA